MERSERVVTGAAVLSFVTDGRGLVAGPAAVTPLPCGTGWEGRVTGHVAVAGRPTSTLPFTGSVLSSTAGQDVVSLSQERWRGVLTVALGTGTSSAADIRRNECAGSLSQRLWTRVQCLAWTASNRRPRFDRGAKDWTASSASEIRGGVDVIAASRRRAHWYDETTVLVVLRVSALVARGPW